MKKLLLFDLDGTLLRSDKTISDYTISVLNKCRQVGCLLAVSTARGESNALQYISAVQPNIIISSGGALVTYNGEKIFCSQFSEKDTQKLINTAFFLTHGNCEITVDTIDKHYWNYKNDPHLLSPDWGEVTYTDYKSFCETSLKICVELTDKTVAEAIAESVTNCDCVRFSDGNWYKFTCKNATKSNAVRAISDSIKIPFDDMIAFGDDYVDIDMLKMCGVGVAMENAIDEVKDSANYVTLSNDCDGVAKWLEENVLLQFENLRD